jgi:uncharacterized protein YutE (UPF0331/DUF86 family)
MVGEDGARRLLTELLGSVSDLKRYRVRVTRHELRTSRDVQHMMLQRCTWATQSALDLAMHLGADAGLPQAETYQDAFRRLGEAEWLEPTLAESLAAWAGFRNVLAHLYASVRLRPSVRRAVGGLRPRAFRRVGLRQARP